MIVQYHLKLFYPNHKQLKNDLAQEQMQLIRDNEAKIREDALEKSKEILSATMQRCMIEQVVEFFYDFFAGRSIVFLA